MAQLTMAKIMFDSVISTENARFAAADIKDFYLNINIPMVRYEYVAIPLADIPETIIKQYNYWKRHTMVLSMWKSKKECMAFYKWAALQTAN